MNQSNHRNLEIHRPDANAASAKHLKGGGHLVVKGDHTPAGIEVK